MFEFDNIDFLKNKNITVLCSGNSSNNYLDSNDILLVPNRSILMPQIEKYEKIIWVNGTGWQRKNVLSWWKELAKEIKKHPQYMLVRYSPGYEKEYAIFEKEFREILPITKIEKISISSNSSGILSTGMRCIKLAIDSQVSNISVAGMEMGENTKYSSILLENEIVAKKGNDSFTRHLNGDIQYLKNLTKPEIKKIIPVFGSGLYHYMRKKNDI